MQRVTQESEETGKELELFRVTMEENIATLARYLCSQKHVLLVESESRYQQLNLAYKEEITALKQELADLEKLLEEKETIINDNAKKAKEELQKEVPNCHSHCRGNELHKQLKCAHCRSATELPNPCGSTKSKLGSTAESSEE